MLQMLIAKFPGTYIFLDGLDEECENEQRWRGLLEVLQFLNGLPSVRLWCSSQDRARLHSVLEGFALIEMSKDLNNADIELCLSRRISELDALELDEGYRRLILGDLLGKADGCFLWASLMLDSIADAHTLNHVQQEIQGELPEGYEQYYARKLKSIKEGDKGLAW